MVLAGLGASVTKVERLDVGDDTRAWGPPYDASGVATYFQIQHCLSSKAQVSALASETLAPL
jgi:crotonobetainyl-CoA:carnitine CoA-transferase CaiB-like acyl-CoA transferase